MRITAGLLLALVVAPPAFAQGKEVQRPEPFKKLIDCRAITQPAERLACFDREIASVMAAEARNEIVVFDREQVRKTQRSLFGLSIPNFKIFGDDSPDSEKEIESTIKRVWTHTNGKWGFELADGARWVQIDSRELVFDPEPGQPIRIRRAALGSYLANVDKQVAIRVGRIH